MKTIKTAVVMTVAAIVLAVSMLLTGCGEDLTATPDQTKPTTSTIAEEDTTSTQVSTDADGKVMRRFGHDLSPFITVYQ